MSGAWTHGKRLSKERWTGGASTEFKRGRETLSPGVIPENRPNVLKCDLKTEPYVNLEVEGINYLFLVDTGAAISIVKPDKLQH